MNTRITCRRIAVACTCIFTLLLSGCYKPDPNAPKVETESHAGWGYVFLAGMAAVTVVVLLIASRDKYAQRQSAKDNRTGHDHTPHPTG